jgi:hypothetical protein
MYQNPALAQIQRDIKSYDKDKKQIVFRDSSSMNAFISYIKGEKQKLH